MRAWCGVCGVCVWVCGVLLVWARKMPPQPRPPSRRAAWLRPLPAPQSEDCVRGRVHRHATLRVMRAQRGPLRALRFARALDCFAICAASLRKLRFLRHISGGGISRPAHSVSAELVWRSGGARGCLRTLRVRLRRIFPPLRFGAFPATARASGVRRAIHPRLRREALGRNTSRRAAQPHSRRLPRPAVCACSASCRRLPAMLRAGKR